MMKKLSALIESSAFQMTITVVIVINAILMGFATDKSLMAGSFGTVITALDTLCLIIFVIELVLKLVVYRFSFFKSGWNIFDFVIVAIALVPDMQMFSAFRVFRALRVLRSLRSLRAFRMISGFKKLRIIVSSIFSSLPGVLWTGLLLLIEFYIFAIIGTTMFGDSFPEWFGSISKSLYTLFQVMTLESWSMGIARPVMEAFSWAWIYFVPFVVISSFVVMNVVVGIVVNTISETSEMITKEDEKEKEEKQNKNPKKPEEKKEQIQKELAALKEQITHLESLIQDE